MKKIEPLHIDARTTNNRKVWSLQDEREEFIRRRDRHNPIYP